ncbi:MAG: hypothetical protein KJ558_01305 [Gammaproteobacteria bacterium]|nr:hypothetical protein [Gammaproteobacteria bacterium]MBU1653473.1 hypothetical protein [Gammaproteobacteria bacterium]MBU1962714.1 hypothetical protein [Gammaproteobacteria bacterium]
MMLIAEHLRRGSSRKSLRKAWLIWTDQFGPDYIYMISRALIDTHNGEGNGICTWWIGRENIEPGVCGDNQACYDLLVYYIRNVEAMAKVNCGHDFNSHSYETPAPHDDNFNEQRREMDEMICRDRGIC